mmetsp:Transcript_104856/g.293922  ORF Transcript_104856/g.293922 Transcript_104856/m.293922 type:complete len:225 (+) Transcript_104856:90-764(+)
MDGQRLRPPRPRAPEEGGVAPRGAGNGVSVIHVVVRDEAADELHAVAARGEAPPAALLAQLLRGLRLERRHLGEVGRLVHERGVVVRAVPHHVLRHTIDPGGGPREERQRCRELQEEVVEDEASDGASEVRTDHDAVHGDDRAVRAVRVPKYLMLPPRVLAHRGDLVVVRRLAQHTPPRHGVVVVDVYEHRQPLVPRGVPAPCVRLVVQVDAGGGEQGAQGKEV